MIGEPNYLRELRLLYAGKRRDAIVSGLGTSAHSLVLRPTLPREITTCGVNDGGAIYKFDYTVIIDGVSSFPPERLERVRTALPLVLACDNSISELRGALPTKLCLSRTARAPKDLLFYLGGDDEPMWPFAFGSPMTAAWLAVFMGHKRVGVVGVDMWPGNVFEPYSEKLHAHATGRERKLCRMSWGWFATQCKAVAGADIINLAPGGILDGLMETMRMEEFLR